MNIQIELNNETILNLGPSSDSDYFQPKPGSRFNLAPISQQELLDAGQVKLVDDDKNFFYLAITNPSLTRQAIEEMEAIDKNSTPSMKKRMKIQEIFERGVHARVTNPTLSTY